MYASINFPSKKALKEAVAKGETVTIFNPSGMYPAPENGKVTIEGPHYPKPHKWYATAEVKEGRVIKVS